MSSDYRSPIWPFPVTAIGVVLACVAFSVWVDNRPASPPVTASTPAAASTQDMSHWQRVELECDRQVQILMNAKDMMKLARAQFLIRWFDCSVGRRLPPP
jgi:hypothetical protein